MINHQATKETLKPIEAIASGGHHMSTVFRDWVSLMLYSLMRDDELYGEVLSRYNAEKSQQRFAEAFSVLMKWMQRENHDLLGDVYMELAGNYSTKNVGGLSGAKIIN